MNPDRFELDAVPDTDWASVEFGRNALVRMLSAVWSVPSVCVWVASPVHPEGRNACPFATLSPPTAPMKNDACDGAPIDRPTDVAAAA